MNNDRQMTAQIRLRRDALRAEKAATAAAAPAAAARLLRLLHPQLLLRLHPQLLLRLLRLHPQLLLRLLDLLRLHPQLLRLHLGVILGIYREAKTMKMLQRLLNMSKRWQQRSSRRITCKINLQLQMLL
jgi:hypothetical protein